MVWIPPAQRVPVDGIVIEGRSTIDESTFTGEPIPVEKGIGANVWAGTMNGHEGLLVRVTHTGRSSALGGIIDAVVDAQETAAPIEALTDRISKVFVPTILGLSLLTWVLWHFAFDSQKAVVYAIDVLVIACPCALGLATPIVLFKTATKSKAGGFLFKNFDILQKFGDINTLIFDKTGTLSSGIFKITNIEMPDEIISEEIFLKWVASVENFSQHPIAKSIVYQSEIREITLLSAQDVKEQSGVGIEGVVEGQHIKIQNNVASKESSLKVTINEKVYIIYLEEESSVSTNFL